MRLGRCQDRRTGRVVIQDSFGERLATRDAITSTRRVVHRRTAGLGALWARVASQRSHFGVVIPRRSVGEVAHGAGGG
jgi:hypothetical protein